MLERSLPGSSRPGTSGPFRRLLKSSGSFANIAATAIRRRACSVYGRRGLSSKAEALKLY